jgi:hypothetical protein
MKKTSFIAVLLCGAWSLASAAEFYTPISVVSNNSNAYFPIERLFQGPDVGFDSAEPHNAIDGQTWVTDAPGGYPSNYVEVAGAPVLIVDLGADTDLAEISVWGYAAANDNGVKEFQLRFATEAEGEAGFGTSITYNPMFTAIKDPLPRQSFFFDRLVKARYVEMTCTATFFVAPGSTGGDRVGLGEIAFEKFISPPEPNLIAPATLVIPPTRQVADGLVTLRNTGLLPLTISNATIGGANATAFAVVSRPTTLNNLQSGDVVVRFTPGALLGDVFATLTITSNDPDAPTVEIPITTSVPPPPLEFFPIAEITSSTQDTDFYPVGNLIQGLGEGFDANWPHDQLGAGGTHRWVTSACGFPCDYLGSFPPPVFIVDLGQNRTLQEINIWGYTATNANGLQEFQLRFATDAEGNAGFGTSITYNPTFLIEENNDVKRFPYAFTQPVVARYVEFSCTDNYFVEPGDGSAGGLAGGDRMGLGEIAFPTATSVGPAVPLVMTAVQRNAATGAVTLTFSSETGKTYTIKRSTDLAGWTDLASEVPAAGATTDYTDSDILPSNQAFYYRVTRP